VQKARQARRRPPPAPVPHPVVLTAILVPAAVWLAVTPYVTPWFGYTLDVPPMLEVVDHVLPAVVTVAAAATALLVRQRPSARYAFAVAASVALLAGLWSTATHVPLLAQARQGLVAWETALFHSTPGVVVMAVALAALVPALRNVD